MHAFQYHRPSSTKDASAAAKASGLPPWADSTSSACLPQAVTVSAS